MLSHWDIQVPGFYIFKCLENFKNFRGCLKLYKIQIAVPPISTVLRGNSRIHCFHICLWLPACSCDRLCSPKHKIFTVGPFTREHLLTSSKDSIWATNGAGRGLVCRAWQLRPWERSGLRQKVWGVGKDGERKFRFLRGNLTFSFSL